MKKFEKDGCEVTSCYQTESFIRKENEKGMCQRENYLTKEQKIANGNQLIFNTECKCCSQRPSEVSAGT